jgi:hypothetical protein
MQNYQRPNTSANKWSFTIYTKRLYLKK